jgi:hypothetical protein
MRIRRGLLFAGLFFIPLGAMTLLVRAGTIEADALAEVWRLWPLILIGFGIALLLGRSRAASLGTAFAALVLGVLVGSAIASGDVFVGSITDCGLSSGGTERLAESGTFGGPATVAIDLRCGSASLATQAGSSWSVAAEYRGGTPTVTGSSDRLEVRVPDASGVQDNDWTIAAPADLLRAVELKTNAATGSLTLDGATLTLVQVDANAGDILVDAGGATLDRIEVTVNAGRARITLGQGATVGDISVNAGAIDLCVPAEADLRLNLNNQLTFVTNLADRGLKQNGTIWRRTGSAGGPLIDLTIDGNVASFALDPSGGCR